MVIDIDNIFEKIMEYESRLVSLDITEKTAEYFNENSEEKKQRIKELYELKKEIVYADINSYYKDSFLRSIDQYLELLEPKSKKGNGYTNDLLLLLLGAGLGVVGKHYFDKTIESFETKMTDGIVRGFEKGLIQK